MKTDRPAFGRDRHAAEQRGRRAETIAAWFLRLKGYRLLGRRYRTAVGEIDLIMRQGRQIVFVEVKHRAEEIDALQAVTSKGRQRIVRAAEFWLAQQNADTGLDLRFDVVAIMPGRLPRHYRGLFDATGAPW
jgi:putative endonuclease